MGRGDSFSIRQMVDLTGLSEFTIRGWETRYRAFKPDRTSTGRRIYSHSDIQKAILLRELILREHRIGKIAQQPLSQLKQLLEQTPIQSFGSSTPLQGHRDKIIQALALQNWDSIESELRLAVKKEKAKLVLTELIAPLVADLGQMAASGGISIAQEHIFSALLKERLYVIQDLAPKAHRGGRFVVAAPEGDFHELGILIAHAILARSGFKSLYLGPNTPKKDLCETALRFGATHVLIGSTVSRAEGAKEDLLTYLHFLNDHLGRGISVWVGGRNSSVKPAESGRPAMFFSSLKAFEKALRSLD